MINKIKSCEINIDTACVEVKLTDGSMVSIDCDAVEDEYANNMYEVSELDYIGRQNAVCPRYEHFRYNNRKNLLLSHHNQSIKPRILNDSRLYRL
ncbi:MAG: hypothetical protein IJZ07_01425 [Clostridia bacterium]|nr:hypothetical protein [Clostridia bacterium]